LVVRCCRVSLIPVDSEHLDVDWPQKTFQINSE